MDAQGRNLRNVTQHPAWDYWPAWSPDGRSLVFVSERDGDQELFVSTLESPTGPDGNEAGQATHGQPAIQLTFNDDSDRLPAWSPDGSRIAFAAVRNGVEEIHVVNADGSHERPVVSSPLKGTAPAWSPDGRRIAFVGWNEEGQPGIYIVGPEPETIELVWQATGWIGSLAWTAAPGLQDEEGWLLFTAWNALRGNHELYALPAAGGTPLGLTQDPAWDDFPAPWPGVGESGIRELGIREAGNQESGIRNQGISDQRSAAQPSNTCPTAGAGHPTIQPSNLPPPDGFVYGVNMADLGKAYLVRDMGLGWAKSYVNWETVEPQPGEYRWVDPDNVVSALGGYNIRILLRVHGTPAWARPQGTFLSHPPDDVADFAQFMRALATRYQGRVAAYEIWNEPNLDYEWGYREPDPAAYVELLQAAYQAVKEVDPDTVVVSGGLATTGDGSDTAVGDLAYLQGMYDAGARGAFDALGSHPYAFGHEPDYQDAWGLSLARIVQQRDVMLANGDAETPVWITEAGWVLHTSWNLVEHEAIAVSQAEQADYMVRAYRKVRDEWPWVRALFWFNLDFSSVAWYPAAEPMRWYAILNPDRTPRPAYTELKYQISNGK